MAIIEDQDGKIFENIVGTIKYQKNMDDLISQCQDYTSTVNSTFETLVNKYSISGLRMFSKIRKYQKGKIKGRFTGTVQDTKIYGLPIDIQKQTDIIIDGIINDIDDNTSPMLKNIDNEDFTFSEKENTKKS